MDKHNQDSEIISVLVVEDKITAYGISQETGISIPQVTYRLRKMIDDEVVESKTIDDKTMYFIHPVLKSEEDMRYIAYLIKKIVDKIDTMKYISPDGIKTILSFIIGHIELTEPPIYKDQIIQDFRRDIETYAKNKGLIINNIKGWTENKIEWMALNDRKCACAPNKRHCPCPEGLKEVEKNGTCKCSLFRRGKT